MSEGNRPLYAIGAAARMVGVPVATIRNWEERYGLVAPERSASGHRLYSRDDVERLRFVKRQVDLGVRPAEAHRLLAVRSAGAASAAEGRGGGGPVVLLAERDRYAAESAAQILRAEGYEVEVALDVASARAASERLVPDLAVVELLISGGSGADLCRELGERGAACLAISSLRAQDDALDTGADAFLQKPLDPARFLATVDDLLRRSAFREHESA